MATERVVGAASVPLPAPRQDGAAIDQEPGYWWRATCDAIQALGRSVDLKDVWRIAVDGTSGTLLLTDAAGRPCSPGLMYNDARATAEAARIKAVAPAESGAHGPSAALAKLLYLLGTSIRAQAHHALHQADWIAGRLANRFGTSDENNALKLGYDPVTRSWPAWLDALQVPRALLPEVLIPGATIGPIDPAVAATLGLPETAIICAGTTDGVASFIATRAAAPGDAVTSLGTTLVLKLLSDQPIFAPGQGVYSHRLGDRWLAGGASNTGGGALLAYFSAERMAALTPKLDPARPTGLDYYPLPKPGERFPISDPQLAPRVTPRPADDAQFFQGLLEGIAAVEGLAYQSAPRPWSTDLEPSHQHRRRRAQRRLDRHPPAHPGRSGERGGGDRGQLRRCPAGAARRPAMTAREHPSQACARSLIASITSCSINGAPCTKARRCSRRRASASAPCARRASGCVILSNSGRRSDDNAERLADLGLPADEHDGVLTSGEVVWHGLHEKSEPPYNHLGRHALLIARGNALSMIEGLDFVAVTNPLRADFIWLAGLDELSTNPEDWREELEVFAARGLPMLCANPDLTMFTARGLLPAPGALARLYAKLGGTVHYVGKPHAAIFAAALRQLGDPKPERVLVVGDSLDHDVEGGRRAGMLTALITSGVHGKALADAREVVAAIRDLAGDPKRMPDWAIPRLTW